MVIITHKGKEWLTPEGAREVTGLRNTQLRRLAANKTLIYELLSSRNGIYRKDKCVAYRKARDAGKIKSGRPKVVKKRGK